MSRSTLLVSSFFFQVKLNEVLGVLSVEGNPIDVDGLFSRMVGFLSSNLPNSLATVSYLERFF